MNNKGKLIVIDGTDGSGKTTQFELLKKAIVSKGYQIESMHFPQNGHKSAGLVEEYLSGKYGNANEVDPYTASVFYAVDRYDASFKIRDWLSSGKLVLLDRYIQANMGHQSGKIKNKISRDKYLDWLYNLEFNIFNIPKPDLVIILSVDPKKSISLIKERNKKDGLKKDRDIHENLEHIKQAYEGYIFSAKKYNWKIINCVDKLGNLRTIEDISKEVYDIVIKELKN
ncbi:MAG: deoxynucleoside kinase [archaeon]